MDGVSFSFFFNQKFLVIAAGPSRGAVGLGVGLWCWVWCSDWWGGGRGGGLSDASTQGMDRMVCSRGGCIWLAPLRGLPSGQSAVFGAWPWIGLICPGEGLGASLIISLMLCNYIKFQNCR